MQIGMIGLGRMGANMVQRLLAGGHACVVYDSDKSNCDELAALGAQVADSLEDMVRTLEAPRPIWMMVPHEVVDDVIAKLVTLLEPDDIIIDGGNSYFPDDVRRARDLATRNIRYVDVGTSGGIWGRERGYCLMIGGADGAVSHLEPVFRTLAPGEDAAPATLGRSNDASSAHLGFLHCGGHGAGHFVKMVHNGIEYGLMAAYAEGFAMLRKAKEQSADDSAGNQVGQVQLDVDTGEIAELWRRGSVVESWLLDLVAASLHQNPSLKNFSGDVSDSGEGRWMLKTAIDLEVPANVLASALFNRYTSRGEDVYANKVISALRNAFGGHTEDS
jgi:6-phosphogluconate dehydrogenase